MARGSFNVAVTGMLAQADRMSVIGNNIANSRTTAFKANKLSFTEEFVTHQGQLVNGTHNQFGNGVRSSGVTTNWGAGSIEGTSNASNIAIAGDGFLPVVYEGQLYYTRAGDFALVADDASNPTQYYFQRPNGAVLLAATTAGGSVAATNVLYFSDGNTPSAAPTSYEISPAGEVTCLPKSVSVYATPTPGGASDTAYIGVQRFNNPDSLQKYEGGMYRPTSLTSTVTTDPSIPGEQGSGTLMQGSLESSNTDLVEEFTEMIQTQRAFQANAKTITTADEMLQTVLALKR